MTTERLGNIATFINGAAFKPEDWNNEGMKIIRIQNLTDTNKPYNRTLKKVDDKYIVRKGDVLVSWSATIDVFIWEEEEEGLLNQHIFKVVFDLSKVEKRFFIYALKHTIDELSKFAHGSTMKHVVKKDFDNHKIYLPPLSDQFRIAEILSQAESLIIQRKYGANLLDEIIKSTFVQKFIDKKLPLIPLEEITRKITDGEHKKPDYKETGMPFISVTNISKGFLNFADCKYVSIDDHNKFNKRCNPEFEDIIYTKVGATYGRAVIVDTDKPFSLYVSVALIKPDKTKVNPYFLKAAINHPFVKRQADKSIKGAGVPDLHLIEIKSFKIPLPPMKQQIEFALIVEKVEMLKGFYNESLLELKNMFGVLSQRAFKGELNLSKLNIEHINPLSKGGTNSYENLIIVPAKENKPNKSEIGKLTVENLYDDGIAKLIKKHFKNLDFRFSEIIKMLEEEEAIVPSYNTTEELKKSKNPEPIDIQTFIFDCVQGKNKHLKLEQIFFNYYRDYELKDLNPKEDKKELQKKLIGSPPEMTGDDINGIYFRIIQ